MKQKLQAGKDIDILTSDEMAALVSPITEKLWLAEQFDVFDFEFSLVAASGTIAPVDIYTVPVGSLLTVHRIEVNAPGATASAPLAPGGSTQLGFYRNEPNVVSNMFAFLPSAGWQTPSATSIAPAVMTYSSHSCKVLKPGSQLYVSGSGFTGSQVLYINIQVELKPDSRKVDWRKKK
jgi:hypothetical protein